MNGQSKKLKIKHFNNMLMECIIKSIILLVLVDLIILQPCTLTFNLYYIIFVVFCINALFRTSKVITKLNCNQVNSAS